MPLEDRVKELEKTVESLEEIIETIPADMSAMMLAFAGACELLDELHPGSLNLLAKRLRTKSQTIFDAMTEDALNELILRISNLDHH
jgi:hypothetical protein